MLILVIVGAANGSVGGLGLGVIGALLIGVINRAKPGLFWWLLKVLIYIPTCGLWDLISYFRKQNATHPTPPTAWIILGIEVILIIARFLVPYLYTKITSLTDINGDIITRGPIYTNEETDLGSLEDHNFKSYDLDYTENSKFNYSYALSCWIWINPQPPSTNESYSQSTTLLNYGNILKINFNQNKIEIKAATSASWPGELDMIYELKNVPYQKWNNFILNYAGGTLDVFINGKLVSSSINITPLIFDSRITAGANNGIYGGIKNIIYYDNILSKKQIIAIYNDK
jgi:hypothetical protein